MIRSSLLRNLPALLVATASLASQGSALGATLTKSPDQGSYWYPLSPNSTYVYANSFQAPISGTVTGLGTWLNTMSYDASTDLRFQVWGSVGGNPANGPDYSQVLATTAAVSGFSGPLAFYSASTISSALLTAGQTYWFAATAVGSSGSGSYQVGGHTQNSAYNDNGTFWYSNDVAGQNFDGQGLTPEMAFQVQMSASVPDSAPTALLLAFPLVALAGWNCRQRL